MIHSSAVRPQGSRAQIGLAILAVLALTFSFLGLAQPVRADHVDGATVQLHQDLGDGVSGENPGEFAGGDDRCNDLEEGQTLFHFVANGLADGTDATESTLHAQFAGEAEPRTYAGFYPSGETQPTVHWDVVVEGDATLLDAWAVFNVNQTEDAKLLLSHICGGEGEGEVEEDVTLIKLDAEGGLIADVGFTLEGGSEVFTNASGQIVFADLAEGEWTLTETTAPDGCEAGGTLTITVDAEGNVSVTDDDETDTLIVVSFNAETNTLTLRNDCEDDVVNGFVEIDKRFCDTDEGTRTVIEVNDPIVPGATAETFGAPENGCEGGVAHFTIYAADAEGDPVGDPIRTASTNASGSVTFELAVGDYVIVEDSSDASAWFTVAGGMLTIIEVTNFVGDDQANGWVKVLKHNCEGTDDEVLFSINGSAVTGFDPDTCVDGTGTFQIDAGDSFLVEGEAVVSATVGSHTLSELSPMMGTSASFMVELAAEGELTPITTIHVYNVTGETTGGGGDNGNGGNGDDGVEGGVRGGQGGPGGQLPDTATQETAGFPAGILALLVLAGLGAFGALNLQSVRRRIG